MADVSGRRYTPDHVWIDDAGRVGVTAHLLRRLPELVALHLPDVGAEVRTAEPFGALEADKGAFDLHAPCDGVVRERNPVEPAALDGDTWLVRLEGRPGRLLDRDAYAARRGPVRLARER